MFSLSPALDWFIYSAFESLRFACLATVLHQVFGKRRKQLFFISIMLSQRVCSPLKCFYVFCFVFLHGRHFTLHRSENKLTGGGILFHALLTQIFVERAWLLVALRYRVVMDVRPVRTLISEAIHCKADPDLQHNTLKEKQAVALLWLL